MKIHNPDIQRSVLIVEKNSPLKIKDNSIVHVEIISKNLADNSSELHSFIAKIQNETLFVRTKRNFRIGDIFNARVIFKDGIIELNPLESIDAFKGNVFSQLNIPETPFTHAIIELFTYSQFKLDAASINTIVFSAQKILNQKKDTETHKEKVSKKELSPQEKNILFASFLLYSLFASVNDEQIIQLNDALNGDLEKKALLTLINHYKINDRHWFILPFAKTIENILVKGSIRILIDLLKKETIFTEIFCTIKNKEWVFHIQDSMCKIQTYPEFPFNFDSFIVYLKEGLKTLGLSVYKNAHASEQAFSANVDVEI